jgi:hypothetical protein
MILDDKPNSQVSRILMNHRPIYVKRSENDSKYNVIQKFISPLEANHNSWKFEEKS